MLIRQFAYFFRTVSFILILFIHCEFSSIYTASEQIHKFVQHNPNNPSSLLTTQKKKILRLTLHSRNNANKLFQPIARIFLFNVFNPCKADNLILRVMTCIPSRTDTTQNYISENSYSTKFAHFIYHQFVHFIDSEKPVRVLMKNFVHFIHPYMNSLLCQYSRENTYVGISVE